MKNITLVTEPVIEVISEQALVEAGVLKMAEWVKSHRPDCVPEDGFTSMWGLLPHNEWDSPHSLNDRGPGPWDPSDKRRTLSDNEVLAEIAGRKCYDSFAEKAGKKTNKEYFEHITSMDPMHASIMYHAKVTFFFAGVSRKFSHQFIRNYVGSDRDEEGAPSQESTRFTHHYGHYVVPPIILETGHFEVEWFRSTCVRNYADYNATIESLRKLHPEAKRKEIFEAAAGILNMSAETSFVWTTNPMAIRKFLKERCHGAADAEIFRFAKVLARMCFTRWPNLFLGADLEGVRKESQ